MDIAFSTGEGKPKVRDEKDTTVYKRALDKEYNLKMKVRTDFHSNGKTRDTLVAHVLPIVSLPTVMNSLPTVMNSLPLQFALSGDVHPFSALI